MVIRAEHRGRRRKRQDRGTIGLTILSLAIVAAALILNRGNSSQGKPPVAEPAIVAEFDVVSVPVPISYVPTGTKVKTIRFKQVAFPQHQIPIDALRSLEQYSESITIAPLPANLPVFAANLSSGGARVNPVIERIPAGMRAMTVRVDATSAVEGWASSGAIVDVLLVQNDQTRVIAEKVKIISAERSVEPREVSDEASVPKTVTLLVTQEQCLAINTAIPLGKIAFALRGQSDDGIWDDTTFTSTQLKEARQGEDSPSQVNGYLTVHEQDGIKSFALSAGRWMPSQSVPDGFLVAGR